VQHDWYSTVQILTKLKLGNTELQI